MDIHAPNEEHPLLRLILTAATLIALVAMVVTLATTGTHNELIAGPDNPGVAIAETQLKSVRDIGEWEFLTVSDEELVDTTDSQFLGRDKQLTRIYYGTLRIGADLSKLRAEDIRLVGDTVVVKIPAIGLLDENFIDEARTKTFYSKGSWEPSAREAMFARARSQMLARCLTEENIHVAQANAVDEVTNLFQSMGFMYVKVHF